MKTFNYLLVTSFFLVTSFTDLPSQVNRYYSPNKTENDDVQPYREPINDIRVALESREREYQRQQALKKLAEDYEININLAQNYLKEEKWESVIFFSQRAKDIMDSGYFNKNGFPELLLGLANYQTKKFELARYYLTLSDKNGNESAALLLKDLTF